MTEYVTSAEALFFHRQLIEQYGDATGVRDVGALESALHRPQTGYYESIIHEAAALLESLIQSHRFVDGDKRVAFALADVFLRSNGRTKSSSLPTLGIDASTDARLRRFGPRKAASRISRCSCSALRLCLAARRFKALTKSSDRFRTTSCATSIS